MGASGVGMGDTPHSPHRGPGAVDERASKAGLRTVAVFEATKGVLVLVLAAALFAVRDHIEDLAEELIYHLHVGFDHRWAQALLHGASNLGDMRVWMVAAGALSYAAVRFTEAWGLWRRRVWAEWFALLSGALYLPFEIVAVVEHHHWEAIAVLAINLAIVGYMLEIRIREARSRVKAA
jgi:uncharacterized membrane protein (DUF2068 family)